MIGRSKKKVKNHSKRKQPKYLLKKRHEDN